MPTKFYIRFWIPALFYLISGSALGQNWDTLFNRTDSLLAAGNYQEALVLAKQTLNLAETSFGKNHFNYGQSLAILGNIQISKGDYTDAQLSLEEGKKIYVLADSVRSLSYTDLLYNLALLKRIQGHYKQSESIYKEALGIIEQIQGKENEDYVGLLRSLGILYTVSQEYTKAEAILLDVLATKAKLSGKQNIDYASALSSLGTLYSERENYSSAEPYLLEALLIREKILGVDHPTVGFTVNNLGFMYMKQGDYQTAIHLFNRVIALCEKKTPGSQMHIAALNNIGQCYIATNQYAKANFFLQKALALTSEKIGADHPNYAIALYNLADSEKRQGHYQAVEQLHQEALRIYTAKMGIDNIGTAEMLANIAEARVSLNRTDGVDSLYKTAFSITEKTIGKSSLAYATLLNQFSQFLSSQQKTDSLVATLATMQTIINQNLTKHFLYQTTRQKQSLLDKWSPAIRTAFDIGIKYPRRADAAGQAYSSSLFLKNLLLSQHINLFSYSLQNDNYSQLVADTLRRVSNLLATQYTLPISQRKNLDSLETRAETLEKELARQSAPFRQARKDLQVRWEDIRNVLKPTEAAVEFVSFPYHNGHQQTDTIRYLALVLRPGDTSPQLVPLLTDEMPLRQLLARRKGATLYATRGSEIDNEQLSQGDSLYRLIWQPIEHLLTNTKTVYISPSGLLHQVAFAALPYTKKSEKTPQYLIDRYQLKQVSSTRQVATQATDFAYEDIDSAQLYGGIRYDSTGAATTGSWAFLPGTQYEVEQISQFIGDRATVITGDKATETNVKRASGQSPTVLHLATHGFSFPDPSVSSSDTSSGGSRFQRIANPLFRTGLLMAGANPVWQGGQIPLGKDDGILTAYEVANLNLSSTKLVVLSACETALGDIQGSEGVFGLQRAFKMAGTQYLLMSLWPVSDQATSSLMTQFYRNWKKHKTVRQAFQQTQKQMRHKFPLAVWASFVLVE
jgi:CHAT domain-containing protein/Tfp pilus assembly protein PilF